jgi:hypothetical protein
MGGSSNCVDDSKSFVLRRVLRQDGTPDLQAATAALPTWRAGLDEAESGSFVYVVLQVLCNLPEFIIAFLDEPLAEPALKQELRRLSAFFAWSFRRTLFPTPVTRHLRDMFPQIMATQDASEVFLALANKLWPAGGILGTQIEGGREQPLGCVYITADQIAAGKSLEEACEHALDLKTDRPRYIASPPRVWCFVLRHPDKWSFQLSIPEKMALDPFLDTEEAKTFREARECLQQGGLKEKAALLRELQESERAGHKQIYSLRAAILRPDDRMTGHEVCYVSAQDGQWLRCENELCAEVAFADVAQDLAPSSALLTLLAQTRTPLMLFYTPEERPDVEDVLTGTSREVRLDNDGLRIRAPADVDLLVLHRLSLMAKDVAQGSPSDSRDPSHQQGRPEAQVTALYLERASRLWGVSLPRLARLAQDSGKRVDQSQLDRHFEIFDQYCIHAVRVAKTLRETAEGPSVVTMLSRLASLFVLLHKATTPWERSRLRSSLKRDLEYWLTRVDSLGVKQQTYLDLLLRVLPVTEEEEATWQRQRKDELELALRRFPKAVEQLHVSVGLSSRPDFKPKDAWKAFCVHPCTCKGLPDTLRDLLAA